MRVSYVGLGGGGVGASICRSNAQGVTRSTNDPSGGGKRAGSTVWLPRRQRVLIGVDDTDTPEQGQQPGRSSIILRGLLRTLVPLPVAHDCAVNPSHTGQKIVSALLPNSHHPIPPAWLIILPDSWTAIPFRKIPVWPSIRVLILQIFSTSHGR